MSVTNADNLLTIMQADNTAGCLTASYVANEDGDYERTEETDEVSQWNKIRTIRQGYLDATDWYLLAANAAKLQDETAFLTWRTDMLNLPQDYATPELVFTNWPTKPAWVV
jgi:hypothetical protein